MKSEGTVLRSSSLDDEVVRSLHDWLTSYVMKPHQDLGRSGAVCPFAGRSLLSGSITFVQYRARPEATIDSIGLAVDESIESFKQRRDRGPSPELASLVVVFPDLPSDSWHWIDAIHRDRKGAAVAAGLMLGQFHPLCEAPAVHSTGFPVNRAPYPLFVIRRMDVHDSIFLDANPAWMEHYRALFPSGEGPNVDSVRPSDQPTSESL